MRTWTRLFTVCATCAFLGGCNLMEPDYPAEKMVFDDTLVGSWELLSSKGERTPDAARFQVIEREVEVAQGRLNPQLGPGDSPPARAYTVTATKQDPKTKFRFHAYLVREGGGTFLGIQSDPKELEKVAPNFMVLPLHFVLKLERDGDRVLLRAPKAPQVVWVPPALATGWLDAASDGKPSGPGPEGKQYDFVLTNSIERLLQVCRERAEKKELWDGEPGVLVRVNSEGTAAGEKR